MTANVSKDGRSPTDRGRLGIVQEPTGCQFFWLDPEVSGEEFLEAAADRAAIKQNFHDLLQTLFPLAA